MTENTCFNCTHCIRPEESDRAHNLHLYGLGMCAHPSCWGRLQGLPAVTRGCHCGKFEPMEGQLLKFYQETHLAY